MRTIDDLVREALGARDVEIIRLTAMLEHADAKLKELEAKLASYTEDKQQKPSDAGPAPDPTV